MAEVIMSFDPILNEARLFLVASLKDQPTINMSAHPWRNNWKHLVLHSLRVESNVLMILDRELHTLTDEKIQIIRLAAILHDAGKYLDQRDHANTGADIAREWLMNHITIEETVDRITQMIAVHGQKRKKELDFSTAVLKDADDLDEIGAISIFMTGNALKRKSPFYLNKVCRRINEVDVPNCETLLDQLRTEGAREIMRERLEFMKSFADQLIRELRIEPGIEDLLHAL
jgi:HD superfamily phosphodiesterase